MWRGRLACILFLAMGAAPLAAAVVTLPAAKDNTLFEVPDGSLSDGAGQRFTVGRTAGGSLRRGLIAFDVAAVIPAGSTILSAELRLHMSRTPAAGEFVSLHRVLQNWGEGASVGFGQEGGGAPAAPGDATWIHTFYDTQVWSQAGGDWDLAESATQVVTGIGFYSWSSAVMAADVQSWLSSPGNNFGWLVLGNEDIDTTAKRFDSREHTDPSVRPALIIEYQPVPEPGGFFLIVACFSGFGYCKSFRRTSGRGKR